SRFQTLGECPGALHAAYIRADNGQISPILLAKVFEKHGRRIQVIQGNVKKALYLRGVKVHRDDAVRARDSDEVGHQFRGNRNPRLRLSVRASVAEVGKHGGDPACRRAAKRVDHDEKLHHVLVDGAAGRLDHVAVQAPDVLQNMDVDLAVGETPDLGAAQGDIEVTRDFLGQGAVRVAGKKL